MNNFFKSFNITPVFFVFALLVGQIALFGSAAVASTVLTNTEESPTMPMIVSVESRKTHANVGEEDLMLLDNTGGSLGKGAIGTEPRTGGIKELVLTFDKPLLTGPEFSIYGAECNTSNFMPYLGTVNYTIKNNELLLSFSAALENAKIYKIDLSTGAGSTQSFEVMVLEGDASNNGLVNAIDRSVVVGVWTSEQGYSMRTDFNLDGVTDKEDRGMAVDAWQGRESCIQPDVPVLEATSENNARQQNASLVEQPVEQAELGKAPPVILSAVSRRTHSFMGGQDISINLNGTSEKRDVTTEPRVGGITQLRITFDQRLPEYILSMLEKPCNSPSWQPYSGISIMNDSWNGNELVLTFSPGLENARVYKFDVNMHIKGNQSFEVMTLAGDTYNDMRVNAVDRSIVVRDWTSTPNDNGYGIRTDLDLSGRTDGTDRAIAVGFWQGPESCIPPVQAEVTPEDSQVYSQPVSGGSTNQGPVIENSVQPEQANSQNNSQEPAKISEIITGTAMDSAKNDTKNKFDSFNVFNNSVTNWIQDEQN